MRLRLLLPSRVAVDREVERVAAEGLHGQFTVLPRHVDGVAGLVPGLLSYVEDGEETFWSVRAGTLVKRGRDVLVSTTGAVRGPGLEDLAPALRRAQRSEAAEETRTRNALARIESTLVQRFAELEEGVGRG